MPTPLLTKINWDSIYPPFRERCFELAAKCREQGADYYSISGFRSFAEQAALFAQGRTAPGQIVTRAKPGQSAHNYGIAVDWCRDADMKRDGLQPDWRLPDYELLAKTAESMGLEAAYFWKTFKEGPHVQLPLGKAGLDLEGLRKVHEQGGLPAVWKLLDRHAWGK